MNVNLDIPKGIQIQAFYVIFLIHTMQIGAGLMGISTHIFTPAKHDAWISILIAGVWMHLTVYVMIKILQQYNNADLLGIQKDVFGQAINFILGTFFCLYVFVVLLSILLNYIEVVQVFMFPTIPNWLLSLLLLSLSLYAVLGGIRVVTGVSFLFFLSTFWLTAFLYKPVKLMDMTHFTPVLNVNFTDIFQGAYKTSFSFLGLEVLLFLYPYINNKKRIHLSAHIGVLTTVLLTFAVVFVTIGYFSKEQLEHLIWPTLSMFKIIRFPFLERFDLIAVAIWMMIIMPNLVVFTWLLSFCVKRLYRLPQKYSVYIVTVLLFFVSTFFHNRLNINMLTDLSGKVGFYMVFVYPFILLPIVLLKKKFSKKRGENR